MQLNFKKNTSLMHKKEKMKKLARMEHLGHTKTGVNPDLHLNCTKLERSLGAGVQLLDTLVCKEVVELGEMLMSLPVSAS